MPAHRQTTHAEQSPPAQMAAHTHPTTPEERQERKQRIQTHGRSSVTRSIADAIVIKAGDMFFLSEPNGRVPLGGTLGLVPEAFAHRLRIVQPILPDFLQRLEVHRLRVGDGCADLHFARRTDGSAAVTVMRVEGQLEVVTESKATPAQS